MILVAAYQVVRFDAVPLCTFVTGAVILVLAALVVASLWRRRRGGGLIRSRVCPGCGQRHPAHAEYCRRCGQKL